MRVENNWKTCDAIFTEFEKCIAVTKNGVSASSIVNQLGSISWKCLIGGRGQNLYQILIFFPFLR
jgi:hypothetical protein